MHRYGVMTDTYFQHHTMVTHQQFELFQVVAGVQIGPGERGLIAPGPRHETIAEQRGILEVAAQHGVGLQAHKRVAGAHAVSECFACDKALHGLAQMIDGLLVEALHLCERGFRILISRGGDKRGQ